MQLEVKECPCCGKPWPDDYLCEECVDRGFWMDPIGTVHAPGADPAKAYE